MKDHSKSRDKSEPMRSGGRHRSEDKTPEEQKLEDKAKGHYPRPKPDGQAPSYPERKPEEEVRKRGTQRGYGKNQGEEGLTLDKPPPSVLGGRNG